MLTGHESLLRLIGKRRRLLPNRQSILSLQIKNNESDVELVNCPICDSKVHNTIINSHLDECLARGSKRKLDQLNSSATKLKQTTLNYNRIARSVNDDTVLTVKAVKSASPKLLLDSFRETEEELTVKAVKSASPQLLLDSVKETEEELTVLTELTDETVLTVKSVKSASPPPLLLDSVKETEEDFDDNFTISTFIVGRRFCTRHDLNSESRICLSRDPENDKDINAIKVLLEESEHDNSLGYLPKELAQYLAPLIDTLDFSFEAKITSVPKSPTAAIPIQIECKNVLPCDENHSDKIKLYESLRRHALHAAELATTGPSRTTRYQQNLVLIIEEILKTYSHIFTSSEKSFLESFLSLPDDSQRLFARLYMRKGPWFRLSNISYPEIADCYQAVKGLIDLGYIVSFPCDKEHENDEFKEVLDVLNVDELRQAARMLKMKGHQISRKDDMISLLLSSCTDRRLCPKLQSFFLNTTKSCVQISPLAEFLLWRTERLFFLNGEQDLSTFLLSDMGIVTYPAYKCILSEHIFPDRSNLLSYEEAIEIAQIVDESLSKNDSDTVIRCIEISVSRLCVSSEEAESSTRTSMATFLSYFSASWVYSKVVLLGVSFLEHEKRYIEATNLLRQLLSSYISDGRRGYWTLRLSVDLEHLGRLDDSLRVAEDGLLDPWVRAGSRVALQRRVLRVGKPPRRWKIPNFSTLVNRKIHEVNVQGRPLNCKTGMKSIFYGEDGEQCSVEQLALQYYAGEGGCWQGVHTESGIWHTLFGILMWDVLFTDVPNVFRTRFQTAPLDLDTDSFYEIRKELIEEVLKSIKEGMAEEILVTSWESHVGTACRGVNWEKFSLTDLRTAVTCIGGQCLASILRHLAQGYRSWSSGMPDLVLWRLHLDKDKCYSHRGEAKLVEVKGPRDRLSEQQRAWLLVLMDCGFDVEVCKVTPTPHSISQDVASM